MRKYFTAATVFAGIAPCLCMAQDAEVLEKAILSRAPLCEIEALIKNGADVNTEVEIIPGYKIPLLCALVQDAVYQEEFESKPLGPPYNAAEAAEMLLRNGANPNIRDHMGRTPLHFTSHAMAQHHLLQAGADPKLADEDGNLPDVPEAAGIATEGAPTYDDETKGLSPAEIRELGVCYAEGKNGKQVDISTALDLYQIAAEAGDATAARWLGWRYRQGRGIDKNPEMANEYFAMAALAGDKAALAALDAPAPKHVAGKTLTFYCDKEEISGAAPASGGSGYTYLIPGGEEGYVITWQKQNSERNTTEGTGSSFTYTKTGKSTATATHTFTAHQGGDKVSTQYTRSFKLFFTSPTAGKATCTVTGLPETIQAEKIIYTGTFTLE